MALSVTTEMWHTADAAKTTSGKLLIHGEYRLAEILGIEVQDLEAIRRDDYLFPAPFLHAGSEVWLWPEVAIWLAASGYVTPGGSATQSRGNEVFA